MNNKIDRRQRKTKMAITNAFMKLMLTKNISNITIQEISRDADINRSTFYLHFIDIYDVLEYIEKETVSIIFELLDNFDFHEIIIDPYPLLKAITNELEKYPEFNQFLIGSTASSSFTAKIKTEFKDRLANIYLNDIKSHKKYQTFFAISYLTAGVLESYEDWILKKIPITLNELCTILSNQITNGIMHLL